MTTFERIFTHSGGAHADDMMSVCLALALNPHATVYRVPAVSQAVMSDKTNLVLDIGSDDNGVNHFDHHQDNLGVCAFHRYAITMGYSGKDISPSWDFFTICDCFGPKVAAESLGTTSSVIGQSRSLVEATLLDVFEEVVVMNPTDPMHTVMRKIGERYIYNIDDVKKAQKKIRDNIVIKHTKKFNNNISVMFINIEENPTVGLDYFKRLNNIRCEVFVCPDQRGKGWAITRDNSCDPNIVDFLHMKDDARASFVHANGFFMTTKERISREDVMNIVNESIYNKHGWEKAGPDKY